MKAQQGFSIRAGTGAIAGAGIAAVDNFAFGGEVSPIVIVGMLLIFGAAAGMIWGARAGVAAAVAWAWLPMAHVFKHLMGLPDTIRPNTYPSILKLAVFSFVITGIGLGFGLAFRPLLRRDTTENV